jgi:hypothetical protein
MATCTEKEKSRSGVVSCTYNPRTQKVKAGGSQIQSKPDYIDRICPKGGKEEKKRGREGRRKIGGEERRLGGRGEL